MQLFFLPQNKYCLVFTALLLMLCQPVLAENKPEPLTLPSQTPLDKVVLDDNNVIMWFLPDGTPAYNIFGVAMQAMEGDESFEFFNMIKLGKGLVPRTAAPQKVLGDQYQIAAFSWLEKNGERIGDDGLIWYYRFDNVYNDISTRAPWASAFGQSYVIKAFLYAYEQTGQTKYFELAVKAAVPFSMDIQNGGFQTKLDDGSLFFEEIPDIPAAHILNGHMISTVTLLEAGRQLKSTWIYNLGKQGVDTLRRHLDDFDLGYWSRYDLNPKKGELVFRIVPDFSSKKSPVLVDRVVLSTADGEKSIDLDVGASDDSVGAWRISGIEWLQAKVQDKRTVRGIQSGPAKHCGPVTGGSIQNSYLIMQLPLLEFEELSKVPTFFLKIDYFDQSPGFFNVEIQDVSHGNFMGFRELSQGKIYTSGSNTWKSVFIPIKPSYLGWYVGSDYQKYHIKLLKELYSLTGEVIFKNYAQRWQTYLDMHSEENIEKSLSIRTDCGTVKK